MNVEIQNLSKTLPLPKYETSGAAGMDVMACFDCGEPIKYPENGKLQIMEVATNEAVAMYPGDTILVPTGLKVAIPAGYEIQVRPRSGLAIKNGITVLNTPGTIDSDYRGMIGIILRNTGESDFSIKHGDKIAQIVLKRVNRINWVEKSELSATKRGSGGFGSTTKK